jgi:hypothetical protein
VEADSVHSDEGNRQRAVMRDTLPSTVVVDLFTNAQSTSERGRAHICPEPARKQGGGPRATRPMTHELCDERI